MSAVLSGNAVAFHVARGHRTFIVLFDLRTHHRRTLRSGGGNAQVLNPSLEGSRFVYVTVENCRQELRLGGVGGGGSRVLLRIGGPARRDSGSDPGYTTQGSGPSHCRGPTPRFSPLLLWTTALYRGVAYVTRLLPLPDGSTRPSIVRVRA